MRGDRALLYSSRFWQGGLGQGHPFKVERFVLTYALDDAFQLLSRTGIRLIEAPRATSSELMSFYHPDYQCLLQDHGYAWDDLIFE